jgi:Xaa-Pro aminopeptidase
MQMSDAEEFRLKHQRIADWLRQQGAPGVLLLARANVAWLALGGEVLYPTSRSSGFVVTGDSCTLLCPEDDAHRIQQEEIRGLEIDVLAVPHLGGHHLAQTAMQRWSRDLLCDVAGLGLETREEIHHLRRQLLPPEIDRLRRLAHDATLALEGVASDCFRGILETEVASRLASECVRMRITPQSILVGADARSAYAHPLPKARAAEEKLMLSVTAQRRGLNVGLTRTVTFAPPSPDEVKEFSATLKQHAELLHATRSGVVLGEIVEAVVDVADRRWGLGGITGYRFPEVEAAVHLKKKLQANEAITWTVVGKNCRCEDTHIIHDTRTELITHSESWPGRTLQIEAMSYELPDILMLA